MINSIRTRKRHYDSDEDEVLKQLEIDSIDRNYHTRTNRNRSDQVQCQFCKPSHPQRKNKNQNMFIQDLENLLIAENRPFIPAKYINRSSDSDEEYKTSFQRNLFSYISNLDVFNLRDQTRSVKIKDRFEGIDDYIHHFLPNFMSEVTESVHSSLDTLKIDSYYNVKIQRHSKQGYVSIHPANKLKLDFLELMEELSQGSLVLVPSENPKNLPKRFSEWKNFRVEVSLMVFSGKKDYTEVSLECKEFSCPRLEVGSKYYLIPFDSLTTYIREGENLLNLSKMPLINHIINSVPPTISNSSEKLTRYFRNLHRDYNDDQSQAIIEACSLKRGFYMLQGPPGTGKTQVILGLISGFILKKLPKKPRILVCAPSNIAVNDSIHRFFTDAKLKFYTDYNPTALRVGSSVQNSKREKGADKISQEVIDIDLKTQIKRKTEELNLPTKEELNALRNEIMMLKTKIENNISSSYEEGRLIDLQKQLKVFLSKIAKARENREKTTKKLINRADIVFCTLSSAAHPLLLENSCDFDYVIIDESCQSIELSSLIPFQYRCKVAVLIGDPKQLPATTFSSLASKHLYSRSLFERLAASGLEYHTLRTQYRMTREICEFASRSFYRGKLVTGRSVFKRKAPEWMISPGLLFIDLKESTEESNNGTSPFNRYEADAVIHMLSQVLSRNSDNKSIGVISPYKEQVKLISRLIKDNLGHFGQEMLQEIEVRTVDGFQGREKDLIILSCVRTSKIGFLNDQRRMNVAITRARFGLWVLGNSKLLAKKPSHWKNLIHYHQNRSSFVEFKRLDYVFHQANCQSQYESEEIKRRQDNRQRNYPKRYEGNRKDKGNKKPRERDSRQFGYINQYPAENLIDERFRYLGIDDSL